MGSSAASTCKWWGKAANATRFRRCGTLTLDAHGAVGNSKTRSLRVNTEIAGSSEENAIEWGLYFGRRGVEKSCNRSANTPSRFRDTVHIGSFSYSDNLANGVCLGGFRSYKTGCDQEVDTELRSAHMATDRPLQSTELLNSSAVHEESDFISSDARSKLEVLPAVSDTVCISSWNCSETVLLQPVLGSS